MHTALVTANFPTSLTPGFSASAKIRGMANNLRAIRKRRGLTQQQLADLLGTYPGTVSKWERPNGLPFDDVGMIAAALEVAPEEITTDLKPVPLAVAVASAFSEPVDTIDAHEPWVFLPKSFKDAQGVFAALVADRSADKLYPAGSILVVRPLDAPGAKELTIGAKVMIKHRLAPGRDEFLVGLLDRASTGELYLNIRSSLTELPPTVTIQRHENHSNHALAERFVELVPQMRQVIYHEGQKDPAQILGIVALAITPE